MSSTSCGEVMQVASDGLSDMWLHWQAVILVICDLRFTAMRHSGSILHRCCAAGMSVALWLEYLPAAGWVQRTNSIACCQPLTASDRASEHIMLTWIYSVATFCLGADISFAVHSSSTAVGKIMSFRFGLHAMIAVAGRAAVLLAAE